MTATEPSSMDANRSSTVGSDNLPWCLRLLHLTSPRTAPDQTHPGCPRPLVELRPNWLSSAVHCSTRPQVSRPRLLLMLVTAATVVATVVGVAASVKQADATPRKLSGRHPTAPVVHVHENYLVDRGGKTIRLLGVDADGTESACVRGKHVWWGPLTGSEARTIFRWGADAVRVPLNEDCWLGINGLPNKYSSARYQSAVARWVAALNSAGLIAILDLQWSAPGTIPSTGLWPMPDESHSPQFWRQVARRFRSNPGVIFDLFNEPALGLKHPTTSDWMCWRVGCNVQARVCTQPHHQGVCTQERFQSAGMQQLINSVRYTGAKQPVMAGGLEWAGDPCGIYDLGGNGGTCMWLKYHPHDPAHQLAASFHTYTTTSCNTVACWNASVAPVAHYFPLVTGEVGEKACSSSYVTSYMDWADRHAISYLVWSWQPGNASEGCADQGTRLIDGWDGRTNTASPAPAAAQAHLRAALRRQGSRS